MPKSRKKKNADFQKVKFKVGKRLPKGQNETDLSFKSRQLQMPKTKDFLQTGVPQTKRHQTLEELIKHCDANKSTSLRLSAVEGFKELLSADTSRPTVLHHLHQVMSRVAGLLSDPEPTVRQAVIRLCRTIFSLSDSSKRSFFDYLSAQLCCSLNHISDQVRGDALALFDMLLEKYPQQVTGDHCNLVPILVDQMLGRMPTAAAGKSGGVSGGKAKSTFFNPDSKLLSRKWRLEVLKRLKSIVGIFVEKHKAEMAKNVEDEGEVINVQDYPSVRGPTVTSSIRRSWTEWSKITTLSNQQQFAQLHRNANKLEQFIKTVLPFLRHCWVEEHLTDNISNAHQNTSDEGCQLKEESLPMIEAIVRLLHSLAECCHCHEEMHNNNNGENFWLKGELGGKLRELFLPNFPIHIAPRAHKDRNTQSAGQAVLEVTVLRLNLQVCEALASFPPSDPSWPRGGDKLACQVWHKTILTFLLRNLKKSMDASLGSQPVMVLRLVFFHFPHSEKQEKLLSRIQKRFIKAQPLSAEKALLLDLLSELAFELDFRSPYCVPFTDRHTLLRPFLESLPGLLLQLCGVKGSEDLALRLLSVMKSPLISPHLAHAMDQRMLQLLDSQTGVLTCLPSSCHRDFIQAFKCAYRKSVAPRAVLDTVEQVCRLSHITDDIAQALLRGVIQEMDSVSRAGNTDICQHYSPFFFGILVGHKSEEIDSFQHGSFDTIDGFNHIAWQATDMQRMKRHMILVASCMHGFGLCFKSYYLDIVARCWEDRILSKYNFLSPLTVYGALRQWHCLLECHADDVATLGGDHGAILHGDAASVSSSPSSAQPTDSSTFTVVKTNLRLFSRLTFSLVYSLVAMEMGVDVVTASQEVTAVMWKVVEEIVEQSLRVFVDLCMVAADFVQSHSEDNQVLQVIHMFQKLLATAALGNHRRVYPEQVSQALHLIVTAVQTSVPSAVLQPWWQEFTNTWL